MTVAINIIKSINRANGYWRALRKSVPDSSNDSINNFHVIWPLLRYDQVENRLRPDALAKLCDSARAEISIHDSAEWAQKIGLKPSASFYMANYDATVASAVETLEKATGVLQLHWPEAFQEFRAFCWGIVWVRPQLLNVASLSDPKRFGLIHLNPDLFARSSPYELATAIVHETAHHALYVESAIDPLFESAADTPVFSYLRNEMRPAIGALHGLFASFRMLCWANHLLQACETNLEIQREVQRIQSLYVPGFHQTGSQLSAQRLTPLGKNLMADLMARATTPEIAL